MKFLEKYDFSREEINDFNLGCSPKIIGEIININTNFIEITIIGEIIDNTFINGDLNKPSFKSICRLINKNDWNN